MKHVIVVKTIESSSTSVLIVLLDAKHAGKITKIDAMTVKKHIWCIAGSIVVKHVHKKHFLLSKNKYVRIAKKDVSIAKTLRVVLNAILVLININS